MDVFQLRDDVVDGSPHLDGLTRDDFACILDQFPIVKRKDEAAFGEERTKRLCLEAYDGVMGDGMIGIDGESRSSEVEWWGGRTLGDEY